MTFNSQPAASGCHMDQLQSSYFPQGPSSGHSSSKGRRKVLGWQAVAHYRTPGTAGADMTSRFQHLEEGLAPAPSSKRTWRARCAHVDGMGCAGPWGQKLREHPPSLAKGSGQLSSSRIQGQMSASQKVKNLGRWAAFLPEPGRIIAIKNLKNLYKQEETGFKLSTEL